MVNLVDKKELEKVIPKFKMEFHTKTIKDGNEEDIGELLLTLTISDELRGLIRSITLADASISKITPAKKDGEESVPSAIKKPAKTQKFSFGNKEYTRYKVYKAYYNDITSGYSYCDILFSQDLVDSGTASFTGMERSSIIKLQDYCQQAISKLVKTVIETEDTKVSITFNMEKK